VLKDVSTGILERGLSAASLRHQALAANIANVNTPGYKRADIDFGRILQDARQPKGLSQTHPSHVGARNSGLDSHVVRDTSSMRADGNNVDIDVEMVRVAENSLYYAALVRQLSDRFSRMRFVITEGRR